MLLVLFALSDIQYTGNETNQIICTQIHPPANSPPTFTSQIVLITPLKKHLSQDSLSLCCLFIYQICLKRPEPQSERPPETLTAYRRYHFEVEIRLKVLYTQGTNNLKLYPAHYSLLLGYGKSKYIHITDDKNVH